MRRSLADLPGLSTIRARMVALNVAVLGASLLLFGLSAYAGYAYSLRARHDAGLRAAADTLAVAFRTGITVEGGDEEHAAHHLLNELRFPNRDIGLFDAEGRPFPYTSPESQGPDHAHGPSIELPAAELAAIAREHALLGRPDEVALVTRGHHGGSRRLAVKAVRSPTSDASFLVAAEESEADVEAQLALLRNVLLLSLPTFVLLAWAAGWFLARRSLAPIAAMSQAARSMEAHTLGERLPVGNPRDELGQLAAVFNDLLDRLERAFRQMRQFTADASHELRTPLASVRGEAQIALSRRREEDDYRESLSVILEEATHMTGIVEDMFTLARADSGEQPLDPRTVYLDEIVADVCRATRAIAGERGVSVGCEPSEETTVVGDEAVIRRAVLNLVDNAIKYTEPGGTVRARVTSGDGWARVDVRDTGIGIAAEDLGRIFERFYRVDKARSRSAGGAGLGLSIVRWAAEAHGGRLLVESTPGAGSTFSLLLPLRGGTIEAWVGRAGAAREDAAAPASGAAAP